MTARRFSIIQGGKSVPIDSDQETVTWQGVTIGTRALTDAGSGVLDTGGSKLAIADGTGPGQASSKGQLDTAVTTLSGTITSVQSALQGQIDTIDSQVTAIQAEDVTQDANIGVLQTDVAAVLGNTPKEQYFIGDGTTTDFAATGFSFDALNSKYDIEVYQDGRRLTQDPAGSTGEDYFKLNATTIRLNTAPPTGERITIWKQGTSSGSSGSLSNDTTVKAMKNTTGSPIAAGTPVEKLPNGGIQPASAASPYELVGLALDTILAGSFGRVKLVGENFAAAVSGLGFAPGQEVFLAGAGGYTNDSTTIPGGDTIWRIGIADCGDNVFSATATDLIMFATPVLRP